MPLKMLVATHATQGHRQEDVCECQVDEAVILPFECSACEEQSIDTGCGCRRSFEGLEAGKRTTTVKVVTAPWTLDDYQASVYQHLSMCGWIGAKGDEAVTKTRESILRMAEPLRIGDVLERREDLRVRVRG